MSVRVKIVISLILTFIGIYNVLAQNRVKIVAGKRFEIVDSLAIFRADSTAKADSIFKFDSLSTIDTTLLKDTRKHAKQSRELALLNAKLAEKSKFSLTKDTIAPGALLGLSFIPGMGQIYNNQYVKAPVFIAATGAFLTGGLISGGKAQQYKQQWQNAVNMGYPSEIRDPLNKRYQQEQTNSTIFYALSAATYMYSLADATFNYRGYRNPVRTATILAALFPGAGFVYTKVYWRIPIYYAGFVALATVVDYNARSYQRYNDAYRALTDDDPMTKDEFNGRYSAEVLKNAKDGYLRNRDFGIICMVGAYLLSVIDTYVIATLKNWDVSPDLSLKVAPTLFEEQVYRGSLPKPMGAGMSLQIRF